MSPPSFYDLIELDSIPECGSDGGLVLLSEDMLKPLFVSDLDSELQELLIGGGENLRKGAKSEDDSDRCRAEVPANLSHMLIVGLSEELTAYENSA